MHIYNMYMYTQLHYMYVYMYMTCGPNLWSFFKTVLLLPHDPSHHVYTCTCVYMHVCMCTELCMYMYIRELILSLHTCTREILMNLP